MMIINFDKKYKIKITKFSYWPYKRYSSHALNVFKFYSYKNSVYSRIWGIFNNDNFSNYLFIEASVKQSVKDICFPVYMFVKEPIYGRLKNDNKI